MTIATLVATPDPAAWRSLPVWAIEYLDALPGATGWRSALMSFERNGAVIAVLMDWPYRGPWFVPRDGAEALFARRRFTACDSEGHLIPAGAASCRCTMRGSGPLAAGLTTPSETPGATK